MKKKSALGTTGKILGKVALSPFYILKGIWEWSDKLEDDPEPVEKFYCKYCGFESSSLRGLLLNDCVLHPAGRFNGKHEVYEGVKGGKYYCTYCGKESTSIRGLVLQLCPFHPDGNMKGHCLPYEGTLKSTYACKYCGAQSNSIHYLCVGQCVRHPNGRFNGHHVPMR